METSVGQIDVGKLSARPCEYFGIVGCVLAPLGELRYPFQYSTPWPLMTSGGKTDGCSGERFDIFVTAFAHLRTNVNCGEL